MPKVLDNPMPAGGVNRHFRSSHYSDDSRVQVARHTHPIRITLTASSRASASPARQACFRMKHLREDARSDPSDQSATSSVPLLELLYRQHRAWLLRQVR